MLFRTEGTHMKEFEKRLRYKGNEDIKEISFVKYEGDDLKFKERRYYVN